MSALLCFYLTDDLFVFGGFLGKSWKLILNTLALPHFYWPCLMVAVLLALSLQRPTIFALLPPEAMSPKGRYWCPLTPAQASELRPALPPLGPGGPALTGEEVLEPGPQWCPGLHSPWGSVRPVLPQKAPGRHSWQSSTRAAPGASRKVP